MIDVEKLLSDERKLKLLKGRPIDQYLHEGREPQRRLNRLTAKSAWMSVDSIA